MAVPYPATQPPTGAFPRPPSARVAPASRFRAREPTTARPLRRTQRHDSSRPGSLRRSSVKSRRQSRSAIKAMPVAQTRPAPGLGRPHPVRFPPRYREQRANSLFRSAVEILPTRFKDYSPASWLRSSLSRSGLISLGFSKKYSGATRRFEISARLALPRSSIFGTLY